jgi:glycosyltransferase involved in cell wall biosynthesis
MRGSVTKGRRVLMLSDSIGGVWTYSLELAAGLAERGVQTLIAVLGPTPSREQARAAATLQGVELVTTGLELEWQDRRGPAGPEAREVLFRIARRFGADLVHVNGFREAALGWSIPVVLVAHSDVRTWWRACRGTEPTIDWARYVEGVKAGLEAADVIVTPSRAFRFQLERLYGALPKARVVLNGRNLPPPSPKRPRKMMILAAGRVWDDAKNIGLLERAAPYVPWPIAIAGPIENRPRAPSVTYLGELAPEVLRQRMEGTEIFCAPARYEPFGLSILEAAAAGCALVLGDIPTLREIWQGAAVFVPIDDDARLARTLSELTEQAWLRRRYQRLAQERAYRLNRGRMVKDYLAIYGGLVRQSHGRAKAAA